VTPRGALQVDGATEIAVPQVGRMPVTLPLTFDNDTTPEPFDPMGILVVEYARAVTVRARERGTAGPCTRTQDGPRNGPTTRTVLIS
jgi:hypothetical protein